MKYTLIVKVAPYNGQINHAALKFAEALIESGHTIYRIFFYSEGVHTASDATVTPQGEIAVAQHWQTFIEHHKIDTVTCISAALRRGILDETESKRYNKNIQTLNEHYELSGLGQLTEASVKSDRVLTFA